MTKNLVICFMLAALMGLSRVSVGQQEEFAKPPSPEVVEQRLDARAAQPPRRSSPPGAPPSIERLKNLLAFKLPGAWRVDSVDIAVSQNVGTASAPVFKQSFEAQITLKEDLYEEVRDPYKLVEQAYESAQHHDDRRIVRSVGKAGDSHKLVGLATAVYLNGQYNVFFELENLPARKGRPLAEFKGQALVEGSSEAREFAEERERRRQEEYATYKKEKALKHEKAEEEARQEAVEEARRRAAEARETEEKLKAAD